MKSYSGSNFFGKESRKKLAVVVSAILLLSGIAYPAANAASAYVTTAQREKDLKDIAKELVRLQGRVKYLESCVQNLQVDKFSSFSRVIC